MRFVPVKTGEQQADVDAGRHCVTSGSAGARSWTKRDPGLCPLNSGVIAAKGGGLRPLREQAQYTGEKSCPRAWAGYCPNIVAGEGLRHARRRNPGTNRPAT